GRQKSETGFHRHNLWLACTRDGAGRRATPFRGTRRRRSADGEWRLWIDRKLAHGEAAGGIPFLRTRRARLRHVPEGNHEHRLVRCLRELDGHAWYAEARELKPARAVRTVTGPPP